MPKGILLDRDGVLIENRPDYIKSIGEVQIIPGVPQSIAKLWKAGYTISIVSNQAGIAKGLYSLEAVHEIHAHLEQQFRMYGDGPLHWYICPHRDEDQCACRKPKPGMLQKAMQNSGLVPGLTWMVGDNKHDIAAGQSAGCRTALVHTGLGKSQTFDPGKAPDWIGAAMPDFVDYLLSK